MDLKPSVFTAFPWESLAHKSEAEQVAQNMMVIRKRLGDKWSLTWEEYKQEREHDGGQGCANGEQSQFNELLKRIPDSIGAISFSPVWAKAARKITS